MSKKFILGIGAPKCGTTWLHTYLSYWPGFRPAFHKEMHVWDGVFIPEAHRFRVPEGRPILNKFDLMRREMQRYPSAYFKYFDSLMSADDTTHVADITPSYCGLTGDQLKYVYDGMRKYNADVRVVFLMRDPVERCWSMIRMFRKYRNLQLANPYLDYTKDDSDLLAQYALTENARIRTRYDLTLRALHESEIPQENVFLGLYETMFEKDNIEKLSDFLEIPPRLDVVQVRVHTSPKQHDISNEARRLVANHFKNVYHAVADSVPRAKEVWSGFGDLIL